ncbi:PQQ-dependent sugar dehydrogenase [Halomonas saccharevitans]|uniref:PQQ-dependent sugar dehydrogenase n=1 Tax=Halomonas saccharevitans TaxID=416872 RepID=A0ABU3NGJ7_9GAMM|nr:PQQ-dependent sugar dehydrogenase [Halomonas saccharevitans]MDT8880284.1 PQQ-dependent sugar dehydrogenase [Halomonas saccharevitans]
MSLSRRSLTIALLTGAWVTGAVVAIPAAAAEVIAEHLATDHHELRLERIATGLEHPWAAAELPSGEWLVTERPGRLSRIGTDGRVTRLAGVPEVDAAGQGGLLDVVLHPDFGSKTGRDWVYLTWSQAGHGGHATTLSRGRLEGNALVELETLFTQNRFAPPRHHYGSRLAWRADGTLLMSVGERGRPPRAQEGRDHTGSVVRLTAEGGVPADNPFVDNEAVLDEIFTLGHRNPQGLTVAADGSAWSTEHGPRTGDELNRLVAGENYGWPEVSRGNDYATNRPIGVNSAPGMRDPVHVFAGRFAPSGLAEVSGDAFPAWRGDLLAGGLRSERLVRLSLDGNSVVEREVILEGQIGRIRDVRLARDGTLILLTDSANGGLYRLAPVAAE